MGVIVKTRQYTITHGDYANYRIHGRVEGPARPALSTLYKQFQDEFYPPSELETGSARGNAAIRQYDRILEEVRRAREAEKNLEAAGYDDVGIAEQFIQWLCRNHGFTQIAKDDFHVD